ncbi:hypothetical protein [Thermofilum sp.]|uniref:hypothetical protein n=1 Tax=Thermofilum sp. TaxID=1961369 RepID=UPI0031617750
MAGELKLIISGNTYSLGYAQSLSIGGTVRYDISQGLPVGIAGEGLNPSYRSRAYASLFAPEASVSIDFVINAGDMAKLFNDYITSALNTFLVAYKGVAGQEPIQVCIKIDGSYLVLKGWPNDLKFSLESGRIGYATGSLSIHITQPPVVGSC